MPSHDVMTRNDVVSCMLHTKLSRVVAQLVIYKVPVAGSKTIWLAIGTAIAVSHDHDSSCTKPCVCVQLRQACPGPCGVLQILRRVARPWISISISLHDMDCCRNFHPQESMRVTHDRAALVGHSHAPARLGWSAHHIAPQLGVTSAASIPERA